MINYAQSKIMSNHQQLSNRVNHNLEQEVQNLSYRERLPSRLDILQNGLQLDIRAHQRTYEGAYTRTAVGCLAFALMIIKIFSKDFLPIGLIYTIYGSLVFCFGLYKSRTVDFYYNPKKQKQYFKTSGNSVMLLSITSLACYLSLLILILKM